MQSISIVFFLIFTYRYIKSYSRIFFIWVCLQFMGILPHLLYSDYLESYRFENSLNINILSFILSLVILSIFRGTHKILIFAEPIKKYSIDFLINISTVLLLLSFFVLFYSGGYKVYFSGGEFDRVVDMFGLGIVTLLINLGFIISLVICWYKNKIGIILASFFIISNSYTQGRYYLIGALLTFMLLHNMNKKFRYKSIFIAIIVGCLIIIVKISRGFNLDYGFESLLISQLVGDFDTIPNTQRLINYFENSDFLSVFHPLSNINAYIPKILYPDKDPYYGDIFLNRLVFNEFDADAGGTTYTFGFVGNFYSIGGLPAVLLGTLVLAIYVGLLEASLVKSSISGSLPLFYLINVTNVILLYRNGILAIISSAVMYLLTYIVLKFATVRES